ncbi:MAG: hypothetical protein ACI9DC_005142 [Gammaproteobacteria bacterium]|jgi:hypothetical protein
MGKLFSGMMTLRGIYILVHVLGVAEANHMPGKVVAIVIAREIVHLPAKACSNSSHAPRHHDLAEAARPQRLCVSGKAVAA